MKLKRKPAKKELDTTELADQLGFEYVSARERATSASDVQHSVSGRIKSIAKEVGEWEGDRCVLTGTKWRVGVLVTKPTQEVNWVAFSRKHPDIWKRLITPQVDTAKVEKAIRDGTLPRKLLSKFLVVSREPQERVIVEQIGKENENPQD